MRPSQGFWGTKDIYVRWTKDQKCKTEGNKGNFGELRVWFWGTRENAYFPGVQGNRYPNSWTGLINIDEALPCVGSVWEGTWSIVSQNIFGFSLFPKLKILIFCSLLPEITFVSPFPSFFDNAFFCPPEINEIIPLFLGGPHQFKLIYNMSVRSLFLAFEEVEISICCLLYQPREQKRLKRHIHL